MSNFTAATLVDAWEAAASQPPLQRALTLLAAASPDRSMDEWAQLTIGERDERLLRLRGEIFGSALETVGVCPQCNTRVEATFTTAEVIAPPCDRPVDVHVTVSEIGRAHV